MIHGCDNTPENERISPEQLMVGLFQMIRFLSNWSLFKGTRRIMMKSPIKHPVTKQEFVFDGIDRRAAFS